jgi:hypothetical protein
MSTSKFITGIHDPGGEHLLQGRGWLVFTETVDSQPGDYRRYADQGLGVIVRLNNGYGKGTGTIPTPDRYAEFAQKCARWVAASQGVEWITIGNEIALEWEWPTDQPIRLADYIDCYRQCYQAIKAVAPHVKIAPQAVAPWNASTPDAPDWILQLRHMLLAAHDITDWINLHAYTRGYGLDRFTSGEQMNPPWRTHFGGWETLWQFMHVIPMHMRQLPVMVTEANGNAPWSQYQRGWVQALYNDIAEWNAEPGAQQIRAVCLFRWARHDAQWDMSQCGQAHDDLRAAVAQGHQWRGVQPQVLPAPQAWTGYVTASPFLRLRAEPNTTSNVLAQIDTGEQVSITDRRGDWLAATYGALSGWVSAQWVSESKPTINDGSTQDQRSDWEKAIDFVLRWEGGFSADKNDPGNYTGGKVGVGEFKGTKYGISAGSYPNVDIANLTKEQAVEIYRRDYWQRSGADKMTWPLCLVHLDSAVNAGVSKAQKWLAESNGDAMRYMALRLDFYTRLNTWKHFGLAWSRRVAELMKEAASK